MIELYYFSGTGNSLFIAKELSLKLPNSKIIPIASILKEYLTNNQDKKTQNDKFISEAEIIGLIFPCHGLTIPIPIKRFLKIFSFKSSQYIFSIITRGGSVFRGKKLLEKLLKMQNKDLNACFIITMYTNDPKLKAFEIPSKDELLTLEETTQQKLTFIEEIIKQKKNYTDNMDGVTFSNSKLLNGILERMVPFAVHYFAPREKNYFYSNSKCTGCGICEKVCPSGRITMVEERPFWQPNVDCYFCYACLNFCPSEAIQIYSKYYMKSYTEEKGRYPHPYARVNDMINQKKIT